jgi:hypothetical protein
VQTEISMTALLFVLGLAGLFLGGSWLVRGAVALALAFRIPAFVVGATVVGFGTSTPELLVSVEAALRGASGRGHRQRGRVEHREHPSDPWSDSRTSGPSSRCGARCAATCCGCWARR